jgi:hypothetical protein
MCGPHGGGFVTVDPLDGWRQLEALLRDRPHWRLEHDAEGPMWCFGEDGASRIVIGFDIDRFVIYSANTDEDSDVPTIDDVNEWLERHESEHSGFTDHQKELGGYLLASEAEEWLRDPPGEE